MRERPLRYGALGRIGLQELFPRGVLKKRSRTRIVVPTRAAARTGVDKFSALHDDLRSFQLPGRAGRQRQAADRRDRGECFPSESQRYNIVDVVFAQQLARAVGLERKHRIVPVHAATVVGDRNEPGAGALDFNADPPGTDVDRVFNQLLDHRRRAFDDFACRDAVAELFGHYFDFTHDPAPGAGAGSAAVPPAG